MINYKKIFLISFSLVCLIGCDVGTKKYAEHELKGSADKSYLGGLLQFVYVENTGGMLSIGDDLPDDVRFMIFQVFTGLILLGLLIYTLIKRDLTKFQLFFLILILSGGLGNFIDRVLNQGRVIDFVFIQLFGFRTGIFNLADVYVTFGIALLLGASLIERYSDSEINY